MNPYAMSVRVFTYKTVNSIVHDMIAFNKL